MTRVGGAINTTPMAMAELSRKGTHDAITRAERPTIRLMMIRRSNLKRLTSFSPQVSRRRPFERLMA